MKRSRIDGRGLLPYPCKHRHGYNSRTDGFICVECAEDRVQELETIIALFGTKLRRILKDPTMDAVISIETLLKETSAYFDSRPDLPLDPPFERDQGAWLTR